MEDGKKYENIGGSIQECGIPLLGAIERKHGKQKGGNH